MQIRNLLFFGLGLLVGGGLIIILRGGCAPAGLVDGKYLVVQSPSGHWIYEAGPNGLKMAAEKAPVGLVDGKYIVVQSASGHWIYEAGPDGLKIAAKEVSLEGLRAIWELQGAYQPKSILSGTEEIIHLPSTMYRTDPPAFQVIHNFYKIKDGKLVQVPMESVPDGK